MIKYQISERAFLFLEPETARSLERAGADHLLYELDMEAAEHSGESPVWRPSTAWEEAGYGLIFLKKI